MGSVARMMILTCLLAAGSSLAQSSNAARQVVETMLAHENDPAEHRIKYMYLSEERSERTGEHLWQERVVETSVGKVRLLLAEDGRPLSAERAAAERERLAQIVARPEEFQRREQSMMNDEIHAEQMLTLLRKAFLFDDPQAQGAVIRIGYRPDPGYQPRTLEERVLHGMAGEILVDQQTMELRRIAGKMPTDVSLDYGFLGTVHAGSSFDTTHEMEPGSEWKSSVVDTAIDGKAMLFKEISKNAHTVHSEFKPLPDGMTLAQVVAMLER
jgi:hypothetical protein